MTITSSDLNTLVAQELQIIGADDNVNASDGVAIGARMAGLRAWLIEEGLCYWPAEAIPDAVKNSLAKLGAGECADVFGKKYERAAEGYETLSRHCAKRASQEPGTAEYF